MHLALRRAKTLAAWAPAPRQLLSAVVLAHVAEGVLELGEWVQQREAAAAAALAAVAGLTTGGGAGAGGKPPGRSSHGSALTPITS